MDYGKRNYMESLNSCTALGFGTGLQEMVWTTYQCWTRCSCYHHTWTADNDCQLEEFGCCLFWLFCIYVM